MACVAVGKQVCKTVEILGEKITDCDGEIPVKNWHNDDKFGGQYFVLIVSLILIVATIMMIVADAVHKLSSYVVNKHIVQ